MISDKKTALELVSNDGKYLFSVSDNLLEDKEVLLMAMSNNCEVLSYVSSCLTRDDLDISMLEQYFWGTIAHKTAMEKVDLTNDAVYNAFVGIVGQRVPRLFYNRFKRSGIHYTADEVKVEISRLKKIMEEKRAIKIQEKMQGNEEKSMDM